MKRCPMCGNLPGKISLCRINQKKMAIDWLLRHRDYWKNQSVKRIAGQRCSPAWKNIVIGLKAAGIYSKSSYEWDLRIDYLVSEARKRRR